jgi:hypothetical protein
MKNRKQIVIVVNEPHVAIAGRIREDRLWMLGFYSFAKINSLYANLVNYKRLCNGLPLLDESKYQYVITRNGLS